MPRTTCVLNSFSYYLHVCSIPAGPSAAAGTAQHTVSPRAALWCPKPCRPVSSPPTPNMHAGGCFLLWPSACLQQLAAGWVAPSAVHEHIRLWKAAMQKAQSSAADARRSHGIIPDDSLLAVSVLVVARGFVRRSHLFPLH